MEEKINEAIILKEIHMFDRESLRKIQKKNP